MAGGHNTSPSPSHTQALASSSFRTKTTDEEELLSNMGGKKMPNPEEDRPAKSIRKVLVQTGRIRPISNRSPQVSGYHSQGKQKTWQNLATEDNLRMCQQYPKKTPLPNAYETK
jgi:hypothetical protein